MLWQCPNDAVAALVLAHGAGAGMRHASMQAIADGVRAARHRDVALRLSVHRRGPQPRRSAGRRDRRRSRLRSRRRPSARSCRSGSAATRSAAAWRRTPFVDRELPAAGLIFCSFPLHMPGKPDTKRAQHLAAIRKPMLFLSGTRDELAERDVARAARRVVADRDAALARHGRSRLSRAEAQRTRADSVFDEMAEAARAFVDAHPSPVSRRRSAAAPPPLASGPRFPRRSMLRIRVGWGFGHGQTVHGRGAGRRSRTAGERLQPRAERRRSRAARSADGANRFARATQVAASRTSTRSSGLQHAYGYYVDRALWDDVASSVRRRRHDRDRPRRRLRRQSSACANISTRSAAAAQGSSTASSTSTCKSCP